MIPPGYVPPVRNTEDIPIQRDSIGGMTMNAVVPTFKPYVYRGNGEDQYPAWTVDPPKPRAQRKHDPAKIRAANIKRHKKYPPRKHKRKKAKPRREYPVWQPAPEPRPTIPSLPIQPKSARPSPGWQPMVGADLEDLWAELEDD